VSDGYLEAARRDALQSISAIRMRGGRFYRDYLGVRSLPHTDGGCDSFLMVREQALGPRGTPAPGALGTLADVDLGWALRRSVGANRRLATFGLNIRIVRDEPAIRLDSCGQKVSLLDQIGMAHCRMTDERGRLVAEATGTFAVRAPQKMDDWQLSLQEADSADPLHLLSPDELDDAERGLLDHVESSARLDGPDGPYGDYLGIAWLERGEGSARATWPLGPQLWNRSNHIHGGAIFGSLAEAVLACLPRDAKPRLVEQYVQLIRPGVGDRLHLEAKLIRHGQRLTSAEAAILDERGRTVARALATMESAGAEDG
jgi:uncharacterized protein (TIGR00369 family)